VIQLISQQQQQPVTRDADTKATRAEAALTQLLIAEQRDASEDVTLAETLMSSIETFHSNLTTSRQLDDEFASDEDVQRKLMVRALLVIDYPKSSFVHFSFKYDI